MDKIKVNISTKAMQKIRYWVDKSPVEISGMGKITRLDSGSLLVTDVWLVEQENSSTETELNPDALGKLMYETREVEGDLSFWWHSHVNMGVFWSNTDMEAIEQLGAEGYVVATVFNKKNEKRTAYYQGEKDICPAIFIDEIDTAVVYDMDDPIYKELESEFTSKCKQKVYKPTPYGAVAGRNYSYNKAVYDPTDTYYVNSKYFKWDKKEEMWKYDHSTPVGKNLSLLDQDDLEEERESMSHLSQDDQGVNMTNFDGDIHVTNLNLRWSELDGKWLTYDEYAIENKFNRTIMDPVREEWVEKFLNTKGYFPTSDEEVEAYYMLCNKKKAKDFYLPTTWENKYVQC